MHFHYYILEQLAQELPIGEQIGACFSQEKNELIIEWDSYYLRIGCHTPLTYIVPVQTYSRAKKNVVNLFPDVLGRKLVSIEVIPYDRVLVFYLEDDYALVVKLHGTRANVILYQKGTRKERFNQSKEEPSTFDFPPGRFQPTNLPMTSTQTEIPSLLKAISPIFDKNFALKITQEIEAGLTLSQAYKHVKEAAQAPPYFIYKGNKGVQFSLFEPPSSSNSLTFPDARSALQKFLSLHFQFSTYSRQYKLLSKSLGEPYKKQSKARNSFVRSIEQLQQERSPEELGHILMANLHRIQPGEKKIACEDLYQGGSISIKLDPTLSPQDNAQRYYTKYKKQKGRLVYLETELAKIEQNFAEVEAEWKRFQQLPTPQGLELTAEGFDRDTYLHLKELAKQEAPRKQQVLPPFRRFSHMGYDIFVGKNGKNNDELSFKFATKEDTWLHAKDVAGSHVVIRHQAGKDLPRPVLEFAASLAAYFSKSKNDTVVPVIYTPRKYIRKRKGDPPGKVVLNREEVILVEPLRKEEVRA